MVHQALNQLVTKQNIKYGFKAMDKKIQSSTIYTSIAKTKGGEEDYMLDDQQNIKNRNVKAILPLKISSICTLH
jgi:hypothetical protein